MEPCLFPQSTGPPEDMCWVYLGRSTLRGSFPRERMTGTSFSPQVTAYSTRSTECFLTFQQELLPGHLPTLLTSNVIGVVCYLMQQPQDKNPAQPHGKACSYLNLVCIAEELYMLTEDTGLRLEQLAGMVMNPLTGKWTLSTSTEVNYIAHFMKTSLAVRLQEQKAQPAVSSKAADLASA